MRPPARRKRGITILVGSGTARQLGRGFRLGTRGLRQLCGPGRFIKLTARSARQEPDFYHRTVHEAEVGLNSQYFSGFRRSR